MQEPAVFALAVLALLAVPGPTNTLLAAAGATRGLRLALPLLLGELVGYLVAITLYRHTLGELLSQIAGAQAFLRLVVAAYLAWLAVRLWRAAREEHRQALTIRTLFLTTLLNPKAVVFGLLIFPAPPTPILPYYATFCALVVSIGAAWVATGTLTTRLVSTRYQFVPPRICAVALAIFAALLVAGTFSR